MNNNILDIKYYFKGISVLAVLVFVLAGCEENITLDLPKYNPKLAIYCVLQEDELPRLNLTQSKSYFDYTENKEGNESLKNAIVVITTETGEKDTLSLVTPQPYDQNGNFTGYLFEGHKKIEAGKKYYLYLSQGGRQATAETKVPFAPEILRIEHEEDENNGYSDFTLTAWIKDIPGEVNYYNIFGNTMDRDTAPPDPGNPYKPEVYLNSNQYDYQSDNGHDGKEMPVTVSGQYYQMSSSDTISVPGYIVRANKETGEYFFTLNQQNMVHDDPFSEPVIIQHNITGGLGIFGAISTPVYFRYRIK